ncbi:MAG: recombinase zinc beta ribbon domain-containing protein [Ignavibacteriales bacterium]|nr:recombinase zinc beta ribbon domain-containing protein [Ignavibacteriales bacterium]
MPVKAKWENDIKDFVIKENAHPAIISKEIFEKANLIGVGKWAKGAKNIVKSEYLLSGLIKCGKCGFNFQGWTHSSHAGKTRIGYYVDGGYANKGKSVCSQFLIRRDKLESFVINHIKKYFLTPNIFDRLHQVIERKIARLGLNKQSRLEQLKTQRIDLDGRIDNLVRVIETGVDIENLVKRIKVLEEERKCIDEEITKCSEANINRGDIQDLASQIAEGLKDLEIDLESDNIFEKKQLIRRFVRQIIVDRVNMKAVCYIKKIPTVTHKLADLFAPSESSVIIVAGAGLEPAAFGL